MEQMYFCRIITVYSIEQKKQAVKDYLSGVESISDICKKYQIWP